MYVEAVYVDRGCSGVEPLQGACTPWCIPMLGTLEGSAGRCGIVILHFEKLQKAPDTSQESS